MDKEHTHSSDGRQNNGKWLNGQLEGKVSISLKDGSTYIGLYKNGNRNGQGSWIRADETREEGIWENSLLITKNGQASHTYENGTTYVGEWKNDVMYGKGILINQLSEKYEGEFIQGLYFGDGTYTWPAGKKYVGEWKNGNKHGQGTYIMA